MPIEGVFSGFRNSLFIAKIWEKSGELCVVFAQPIPHMVPSCNVTIRSPYIISPALDGPYMRGTSSQFVVTIVVCSSATYGRTFIQAIHRSRVAYAVLKRHIRPICVRVRIGGLIILYSHILLHSKTPGQWPKTIFLIVSKRKNNEDDNIARLLYVLPHLPSDSMRILISNIHCLLFQRSPKERTFASINLCACHLRIDATLFLCLHLPPSLPSHNSLCALCPHPQRRKLHRPWSSFHLLPFLLLLLLFLLLFSPSSYSVNSFIKRSFEFWRKKKRIRKLLYFLILLVKVVFRILNTSTKIPRNMMKHNVRIWRHVWFWCDCLNEMHLNGRWGIGRPHCGLWSGGPHCPDDSLKQWLEMERLPQWEGGLAALVHTKWRSGLFISSKPFRFEVF